MPAGDASPHSARRWRLAYTVLVVATILSFAPLASVVIAGATAASLGCRLDEGSTHPCVLAGVDLGDTLYAMGVVGWLMLVTWPGMLLTLLCWVALLIRAMIQRRASKMDPGASPALEP